MSAYSAIWSAPGPLGPSRKLWPRTLSKRDVAKLREEGRRTKKGQVDLEVRGGWALKPGDHTTTSRARQLGLLAHRGPRVNRAVPASLYEGPPIPKWKQEVAKESHTTVAELTQRAEELRSEADRMAQSNDAGAPSTEVKLGTLILEFDDAGIDLLLSRWDGKNKGELTKAEMRLNLRQANPPFSGLSVSSNDCDAIFDRWDKDGGGTLDLKELKAGLTRTKRAAEEWINRPDPRAHYTQTLRKQADVCDDAAAATQEANDLETALEVGAEKLLARADLRLGRLLQKRMMLPGQVVAQWSDSSGKHAGELSKADFRHAVLALFAGARKLGSSAATSVSSSALSSPTSSPDMMRPQSASSMRPPSPAGVRTPSPAGMHPPSVTPPPASMRPPAHGCKAPPAGWEPPQLFGVRSPIMLRPSPAMLWPSSASSSSTSSSPAGLRHSPSPASVREIDEIFEAYDEDGGGFLDEEEAKTMIKGLRQAGLDAEREQRQREREARLARANASKKALVAMAEMEPMPDELQLAVISAVPSSSTQQMEEVGRDEDYEC